MSAPLFELAIVGGGATGLAAAIQAASDGLRVVLLERGVPGGRIRERARVEVVPGLPLGLSGVQFTEQAVATATRLGAEIRSGSEVLELESYGALKHLRVADGSDVAARAVIAATGAEYLGPALPGLRGFTGRGIHLGVPPTLPEVLRDRDVFVTGAPDMAAMAALELSTHCRKVTLLSAGENAAPVVDAAIRDRLRARPGIVEKSHVEIVEAVGVERLEALILRDLRSGRVVVRNAAALFILGLDRPRTAWLSGGLDLHSSRSGVFAAGGARGTHGCCVESIGGEGVSAARQALHYLRGLHNA